MKYIENTSTDPHYNLAFEEYVFKKLPFNDDYILLWRNEPSIIIGKNQNTVEEINMEYVKKHNIHVVRRITGGGAVYHDLQNLNFSFITKSDDIENIDFQTYTIPMLKALEKLKIPCELSGRNDITIDGKKISGIAQSIVNGKVLNHGTLLFDSQLDVLSKALNVKRDKFESKGIKSVSKRVTNIRPYIHQGVDILAFKDLLLSNIFEYLGQPIEKYDLTEEDKKIIENMVKERYNTWEWNFGESPKFNYKNYKRFLGGSIEIRLKIEKGRIENCKIYGDFFGKKDIEGLEERLKGIRYDKDAVIEVLKYFSIHDYLGRVTMEEFLTCLFDH